VVIEPHRFNRELDVLESALDTQTSHVFSCSHWPACVMTILLLISVGDHCVLPSILPNTFSQSLLALSTVGSCYALLNTTVPHYVSRAMFRIPMLVMLPANRFTGIAVSARVLPITTIPHGIFLVLFTLALLPSNRYTGIAVCSPARTLLLTSRRADTSRVWTIANDEYWRNSGGNFTSLPEHFLNNGYLTLGTG
jgi:hypothetical protein